MCKINSWIIRRDSVLITTHYGCYRINVSIYADVEYKFDYFREQDALKDYCEKINQLNLEICGAI